MAKSSKKRRTSHSPLNDDLPAPVASADANTKGLPTFPMELHLEILSYFLSVPIPCMRFGILPEDYRVKFDVMHALSQTCRALYYMLRPLLWHTLGACALPRTGREAEKSRAMATELVFWTEVVTIRAPSLASMVQVFNVALTAFSSAAVYKEFTQCLALLTNLHTLQIVAFPSGLQEKDRLERLYRAFDGIVIHSLHTLTLPVSVFEKVLVNKIFPNLRHLALTGMSFTFNNHFHNPQATSGDIHTLHLAPPPPMRDLERFVERFPHLRAAPRMIVSYHDSYTDRSADAATYRAKYLDSIQQAFKRISQLTRLHSVQPVIVTERSIEVDPLILEGVLTIAKKFVLGNLSRDENGDVVSGTVKLWVDERLHRSLVVPRPVQEQ